MTPTLPAGCVIALLGADSTGKTELANALTARLSERGIETTLVDDRREPHRADRIDLARIAAEQTRLIGAAAERGVAVADGTALLTAVFGELQSGDRSLHAAALAAQHGYAITLLLALDLPEAAPDARRERTDALLRAALTQAGISYAVIHGRGPERLANAWNAIQARADAALEAPAAHRTGSERSSWQWPCEKCSDPACEHRLFSDLMARRPLNK